jgi:hypothetical protein
MTNKRTGDIIQDISNKIAMFNKQHKGEKPDYVWALMLAHIPTVKAQLLRLNNDAERKDFLCNAAEDIWNHEKTKWRKTLTRRVGV